jgi:hypothetical protein
MWIIVGGQPRGILQIGAVARITRRPAHLPSSRRYGGDS